MSTLKDCTTIEARVAFIREKLASDPAWCQRGLARIYANQTADEQASGATLHDNGIGFTGADSHNGAFWGQIATDYCAKGWQMSDKQLSKAFKFMPKYAAQLERICR